MSANKRRSPFAIVPVEVLADDRLTLRHIRVLVAILSYRSVDTGLAFPTREEIGQRARLPVSRVSTITTELERLGWLEKQGNGGRSRANTYRFCVPNDVLEMVTDPVTVTKSVTVTDSDLNGYRTGNETVTESVRGIEQTNTDHNRPSNSSRENARAVSDAKPKTMNPKSTTVADLKAEGVDEQVAIEFLALRKKKRATLTPLALSGLRREAGRADMTLDQVMRRCIERGWQGFEASWVANDKTTAGATRHGNFGKQDYYAGVGANGEF